MKTDVYLDTYPETEEPASVIRDLEDPESHHNSFGDTEYPLADPVARCRYYLAGTTCSISQVVPAPEVGN